MTKIEWNELPVSQPGISLSCKGLAISVFGANTDGEGTILRLWEQGDKSGNLEVTLPAGAKFTTGQMVNLRGEYSGDPIKITNGILSFYLNAYAPKSYVPKE